MNEKLKINDLDELTPLFDQYMVFYGKESNPPKHRQYLQKRIENNEATVFLARSSTGQAIGFVLNYHSFSSVSLGKIIILNDLYISPEVRNQGIGESLIKQTFALARECGAIRVDLGTAIDNAVAQSLYEKVGFVRDTAFHSYSYVITAEEEA